MSWFAPVLGLAGSIFEGLGALFGGGVSLEELKQALDKAVDEMTSRTYLIMARQIEYHELQQARNSLDDLESLLKEYDPDPDVLSEDDLRDLLERLSELATTAFNELDGDLNLIDDGWPPDRLPITGKGLLGHPWFLTAAGLRYLVLEERIKFYSKHDSSAKVQHYQELLLEFIKEGIECAETMEEEWLEWTGRRFSPLKLKRKIYGMGGFTLAIRYRWVYWFGGTKIRAAQVHWQVGDSQEKIEEAARAAVAVRIKHWEDEVKTVRTGLVDPSREIVSQWRSAMLSLEETLSKQRLSKRERQRILMSVEQANDAARSFLEVPAEAFWKAYPDAKGSRRSRVPAAKPTRIAGRRAPTKRRSSAKTA